MLAESIKALVELLKLSYSKILIGVLILGLGTSIYFLNEASTKNDALVEETRKQCQSEIDSLNTSLVQTTIKYEKEKYLLMKKYYERTDSLVKEVERKFSVINRQQRKLKKM